MYGKTRELSQYVAKDYNQGEYVNITFRRIESNVIDTIFFKKRILYYNTNVSDGLLPNMVHQELNPRHFNARTMHLISKSEERQLYVD